MLINFNFNPSKLRHCPSIISRISRTSMRIIQLTDAHAVWLVALEKSDRFGRLQYFSSPNLVILMEYGMSDCCVKKGGERTAVIDYCVFMGVWCCCRIGEDQG